MQSLGLHSISNNKKGINDMLHPTHNNIKEKILDDLRVHIIKKLGHAK
jgi:hypothetical protein